MTLLVTALGATARPTGLGVYARMVGEALPKADPDAWLASWSTFPHDQPRHVSLGPPPPDRGVAAVAKRLTWLASRLRSTAAMVGADAVLHLLPEVGWIRLPQVIVVHDLIPLRVRTSRLQAAYFNTVVRHSVHTAVGIIADCAQTKIDVENLYGIDPHRVRVVLCGTDLELFNPGARRDRGGYLLTVGNPAPNKRLDVLMAAYAESDAARTHRLKIVGHYDPRYSPALRSLASSLRVADRVEFVDYLPARELAELYASADAYIVASSYEGFVLPGLEALACGTPLVSTDVGAVREYAQDSVAARIVPRDATSSELARAIDQMLVLTARDPSIRLAARMTAERRTWRQTTEELLDTARQLIRSR